MARLTKKARRAAALKGWRNRTKRNTPKHRFGPAPKSRSKMGGHIGNRRWSVVREASNAWGLKRSIYNEHYRAWMEQPTILFSAPQEANASGREWASEGSQSNPPSGFIPCKAVKITRNKGKVEVRIRK